MSFGRRRLNPPIIIGLVLLGLVVLVVCIGGGVFAFNILTRPAPATPAPADPSEADVPTAREAYPPAVEVAREQDPGALLASGAGAWTPTIHRPNLRDGRTGWTFHFYMPGSSTMTWVAVDRGGNAHIVKIEEWETPPGLIDDQAWQVDSAEAITRAMESCQATFDANPDDAEVTARLSLAASNRAMVWEVRVTPPSGDACVVFVDATTGQVR